MRKAGSEAEQIASERGYALEHARDLYSNGWSDVRARLEVEARQRAYRLAYVVAACRRQEMGGEGDFPPEARTVRQEFSEDPPIPAGVLGARADFAGREVCRLVRRADLLMKTPWDFPALVDAVMSALAEEEAGGGVPRYDPDPTGAPDPGALVWVRNVWSVGRLIPARVAGEEGRRRGQRFFLTDVGVGFNESGVTSGWGAQPYDRVMASRLAAERQV